MNLEKELKGEKILRNYILSILNVILLIAFIAGLNKNKLRLMKLRHLRKDKRGISSESIINNLCLNTYEGRRVGSRGNEKAAEYIKDMFEELGISTYYDDTYYEEYNQNVLLKESEEDEDGEIINKTVKNVIGVLNGIDKENAVVISAHLDTVGSINSRIVKGALDNASGIAVLMRLAEEIKKQGKHRSFENAGIPNIYIGQDKANLYIHNYYDTPESINCDEIDKLALCICDFLVKNDNMNF